MQRAEGSFIRWQKIALEQLGYTVGLILSFAAASLAFALSIVKDVTYPPPFLGKAFMILALVSLFASLGVGLSCVINRLRDFRKTRRIARDREEWERENVDKVEIDKRLDPRRKETDRLGKITWELFYWQIGAFGLGILALAIAFGISYCSKLF